jgi:hypothetical protein
MGSDKSSRPKARKKISARSTTASRVNRIYLRQDGLVAWAYFQVGKVPYFLFVGQKS